MAYPNNTNFYQPTVSPVPYVPQFLPQRYSVQDMPQATPQNFLKCRPVSSIEEARVSQIDFDGSLNVFPDIANKKIYTKQINMDGTSSFEIYCKVEQEQKEETTSNIQKINLEEYVTKEELNTLLTQLTSTIATIEKKIQKQENAEAGSKF